MLDSSQSAASASQQLTTTSQRIGFLWQMALKHRFKIGALFAVEIALTGLNAIVPYFTKLQIDQLQAPTIYLFGISLGTPLLVFAAIVVIPLLLGFIQSYVLQIIRRVLDNKLYYELRFDTEKLVWLKLESMDAGFFSNHRNKQLLQLIISSSSATNRAVDFFRYRLSNIVSFALILPILGLIDWQLLLIVGIATIAQLFLSEVARRKEISLSLVTERNSSRIWRVSEALSHHFYILRSMGATEYFLAEYQKLSREREEEDARRSRLFDTFERYDWMITSLLTLFANVFVGWRVLDGTMSIGSFSVVIAYTFQLKNEFRTLLNSVKDWHEINLGFDRLAFFMQLKPRVKLADPGKVMPPPAEITMKSVSFSYPHLFSEERAYVEMMVAKTKLFLKDTNDYAMKDQLKEWEALLQDQKQADPVLKGVSLRMRQGKVTALLGRNGAGKTTITQLLMHQYEPTQGSIELAGVPLYEYAQSQLVQQFGLLQQRPFILDQYSIRENLMLGVHEPVNDDRIWEVLKEVDLHKKVASFPKKLDMVLGEDLHVSGGEEQLIAAARVFLQQRPYIIFDEGMNQLDIEHETKVLDVLRRQAVNAAVLFITRRITTARKADYIYMLDEGVIAEEGTHDELLALGGLYAKFWKLQVVG